jgi:hypothetical protein
MITIGRTLRLGRIMPNLPTVLTLPFTRIVPMKASEVVAAMVGRGWMETIVPGSRIVAVGTRDMGGQLTRGKVYTAINGREEGMFATRPYVTVVSDDGNKHSYHLSRFIPEK